jgi:hypothetical protein
MKNILLLLLLIAAIHTQAQTQTIQREGFNFGFSAGVGYIFQYVPAEPPLRKSIAQSWPNILLGWMINPKLSVNVLLPGTLYKNTWNGRPRYRGFEGAMPGLQYWVTNRWWIGGNAGLGLDAPAFFDLNVENTDERKYYGGYGFVFSSGYEFWQTSRFSMDARVRVHYNNVPLPGGRQSGLSANALLGVSWW